MTAKLIGFEGSDGVGKDTQSDMCGKFLESKGMKVARVSFPRYNQTLGGTLLWEVFKSERSASYGFSKVDPKVASKLYAMDREESLPFLEALIKNNDVVILDRYVESNLLHQGGKLKTDEERIKFAEWLYALEYKDIGLPKPDKFIYLTIPFWLSRKRAELRAQNGGSKLDALESDIEYIKKGHEGGLFYAQYFGWTIIDGIKNGIELSKNEIHLEVIRVLGF